MGYQLLIPLYCNQWGKARGSSDPILFAVHLDELSIQLGSAWVGCTVGNIVVNHPMFADDICVFSPSISGLQCLLNICGDYAAEHEITFNCSKTIGVLFCPKKYKQPAPSNVFLNSVRIQFFWPSDISWCVDKCIIEGWWWYSETSEITILCSKQTMGHFWSVLSCSKKHFISCLLHANVCLPIVEQIYADQYEELTCCI